MGRKEEAGKDIFRVIPEEQIKEMESVEYP